jgi:uncharacterized ferredoxin-like protein
MLKKEEEIRDKAIIGIAEEIALAVRTAPKTRGIDNLSILVADGDEMRALAAKMEEIFEQSGGKRYSFSRDAKGVLQGSAVLLVGVKSPAYGLNCGWCGFPACAEKPANVPCVFGAIDLGIGSGVAAAGLMDNRVDNRMMYSMGFAALQLGWFGKDVTMALGFPLSVSGKNPYFDRG